MKYCHLVLIFRINLETLFQNHMTGPQVDLSTTCLLVKPVRSCLVPKRSAVSHYRCTKTKIAKDIRPSVNWFTKSLFQDRSSKRLGECYTLERLSDELRAMEKMLTLLFKSNKDEETSGYWNRVATRVDKAFFVFYVLVVILFLVFIFLEWQSDSNDTA